MRGQVTAGVNPAYGDDLGTTKTGIFSGWQPTSSAVDVALC
jgi:hypothetical protein